MSFHTKNFIQKLETLENTPQSIQSVRKWLMVHRKKVAETVNTWESTITTCPPKRILLLFYLANDVVQTSRKKYPEFADTWKDAFVRVIPMIGPKVPENDITKLKRVFDIWQQRNVYDGTFCRKLSETLDKSFSNASGVVSASSQLGASSAQSHASTSLIANHFVDSLNKKYTSIASLPYKSSEENKLESLFSILQTAVENEDYMTLKKDITTIESVVDSLKKETDLVKTTIKEIDEEKEVLEDNLSIIQTLHLPKWESLLQDAFEFVSRKRKLEEAFDGSIEPPTKKMKEDETPVISSTILNAPPPDLADIDDLLGSIAKMQGNDSEI